MNKLCAILILCCAAVTFSNAQTKLEKLQYIEQYKNIAVMEMSRTGIPASIKLAQACVESGYGTSSLARKAGNHFGVKCGREWLGDTYYLKDDDYDDTGKLVESCFRRYESPEASFVAHSEFLRDPNKSYRYGFLFRLEAKDYKRWAQGLYQAGYATNPNYPNLLINTIEDNQLFKYDEMSPGSVQSVTDIVLVNDAKMVLAKAGDTPTDLAARYNIKVKCLLKFNEKLRGPNQPLVGNSKIFIQKKRRFFRGKQNTHFVQTGETMYAISQLYGVRLSKLYRKNRMEDGTQPAIGEKISIRGRIKRGMSPKLRDAADDEDNNPVIRDNGDKLLDIDNSTVVKPSDLPEPSNTPINTPSSGTIVPSGSSSGAGNTPTTSGSGNVVVDPNNGTSGSVNPNPTTGTGSGTSSDTGDRIVVTDTPTSTTTPTKPQKPKKTKPSVPKKTDTKTPPSTGTSTGTTTSTTPNPSTGTVIAPTPKPKPSTTTAPTGTTKPTTSSPSSGTTVPTTTTTTPPASVPATAPAPTTTSNSSGTTGNGSVEGAIYYSVATGDTMYSVAKKFGTSVDAIKTLNNLTAVSIRPGQFLRVK